MRIDIGDKIKFSETIKELFDLSVPASQINGITIDSRNVLDGDIFIAMKGNSVDSHDFINSKLMSQASLIINEQQAASNLLMVESSKNTIGEIARVYRKKMNCKVVGITGSNGKTTTKEILFHALKDEGSVSMTPGNYNSTIGMPMSFLSISRSDDVFIAEMGVNSKGEMKYLSQIARPNLALITNISEAHIQNFNSLDEIYNEKVELLKSLDDGGMAFLNMDDTFISKTKLSKDVKVIQYGFNKRFDYFGEIDETDQQSFFINGHKIKHKCLSSNLIKNLLAAFSIASELGIDVTTLNKSISSFDLPIGRGKVIKMNGYVVIDDTYNSNFTSTVAGIASLQDLKYSGMRKIIILGDMLELGENTKFFHENLLDHIDQIDQCIVLTYGNLMKFLYIKSQSLPYLEIEHFEDQNLLIERLSDIVAKKDVIYIKGSRGMRMENIIKGLL